MHLSILTVQMNIRDLHKSDLSRALLPWSVVDFWVHFPIHSSYSTVVIRYSLAHSTFKRHFRPQRHLTTQVKLFTYATRIQYLFR